MSVPKAKALGKRLRRLCGLALDDVFPFEAFTLDVQKLISPQAELEFFSKEEADKRFFASGRYLASSFGKDKASTRPPRVEAVYFDKFEEAEQRQWATFSVAHELGHMLLEHPGINKFMATQRDILIASPDTTAGIRGVAMQGGIGLSDRERRRAWSREIDANTFAVYFLSTPETIEKHDSLSAWANWFDLPDVVARAFEGHFNR